MLRKIVSGIMLTLLLLIGMLTLAFNIQPGKASGTIYIRADGSIDPPDAPIYTDDNITYIFMDNIYDEIVVERDHVIINGNEYTLQGPVAYASKGIDLSGRSNVTITNTKVKEFYYGIYLCGSSNISIVGNDITANYWNGIWLGESSNHNAIVGNNIKANNGDGIELRVSNYNSIVGNNITTNRFNGIVLTGKYINGIWLYASNNSIVRNNIKANLIRGIVLFATSLNNTIIRNSIIGNNEQGIELSGSSNNYIVENNIISNGEAVRMTGSSENIFYGNNMTNNGVGIRSWGSSKNTIYRNNINNNNYGIKLQRVSNNMIYHNNFINNTIQVYDYSWDDPRWLPSINTWDDGYPSGGNYWSDYTGVDLYSGPYQNETGSDGIGDTPYVIDENNQDNYPLMKPWIPAPPPGTSADLVRRAAWPEHHRFVLSKDGDPEVEDRHGTPGYQTLYGSVKNTGNVTLPPGTYKIVWNVTTETAYVNTVETFGTTALPPGELTQLTYDVPAEELPPDRYYVEAKAYYYGVKGEKTKTFTFTVVP